MKTVIRERLLQFITEHGLDDEIVRWCHTIKDRRQGESEDIRQLSSYIGFSALNGAPKDQAATAPTPPVTVTPPTSVAAPERKDVNPGKSAIGKIGTSTKETLLNMLNAGQQPSHEKMGEHLKLLHNRGEVKFDGKEYYL